MHISFLKRNLSSQLLEATLKKGQHAEERMKNLFLFLGLVLALLAGMMLPILVAYAAGWQPGPALYAAIFVCGPLGQILFLSAFVKR